MCVYVYVYIYIYIYVYIYIYMYMYTCTHTYICIYIYNIHMCVHVINIYIYIWVCLYCRVVASYPSNKPRKLSDILPYGLRIILCVRAQNITEPTWVGLGPSNPGPGTKAQGPRSSPRSCWAEPDPCRLGNMMGPDA